jgi:ubiquinol-cytochrome c reductase cytochrome b subunit
LLVDVESYKKIFGGNIYFDKSKNGYYKWCIWSRPDLENFIRYTSKYSLFSNKKQRLFLINEYYRLKHLKAYLPAANSLINKAWTNFNNKWNDRG